MTAVALLDHLALVHRTGEGRWVARCPSHEDRRPSLSIRELEDQRVLLHCHAGCSVENVLGAVGLGFDALFPPRTDQPLLRPVRKPWRVSDVVAALRGELTVAFVLLASMRAGTPISNDNRERAGVALDRIGLFLEELDHVH